MIGEGFGCLEDFAEEWRVLQSAMKNTAVIQNQSMSGIAAMKIRRGRWIIEIDG